MFYDNSFGGSQLGMNGYGGGPSAQEYHHYYGPNGEELSGPGQGFSGRMSGQFPATYSGYPRSYTVVGLMEGGRVIGLDPEVSTPGVSHLPTSILQELASVYGHLGNARFSVSCSDGRFSIQAEVLPPPLPPPPPQRRPPYFGDGSRGRGSYGGGRRGGYGRQRKGRRGRHADFEDEDDDDVDDEDEIVIEIPMETYQKLQEQKRRHGRKPDILIDDSPNVYQGHSISGYNPHQNQGHGQNTSPNPITTPVPTKNHFHNNAYNRAGGDDPNAYYVPDDQGQLVQEYRRRQKAKAGGRDDGDNYEPVEMQTGRSKFSQVKGRHSDGAGTDMGAPPDSYIMDKYLKTYSAN